jgi:hypothetical protein
MILPIPRYLKNKNRIKPNEVMNPRRLLAKMVEKVNRKAKKRRVKNNGTAPKVYGSMK